MIGYTVKTNGTKASFTATTNTIYATNTVGISIIPGSYIVCMYINCQTATTAGTFGFLTTGLSTSNSAYTVGIGAISVVGTNSIPSGTNRITGGITHPLVVTTTAPYFLLMNCSFSGFTLTVLPSYCYFTYTRIG